MPEQLELFDLPEMKGHVVTFRPLRYPIWTENKARLIERYLYYFVLITRHGAYIDGFAGPQQPDKPDTWAAKLVLETRPRWLRSFFLCDADYDQAKRLEELKASQPPPEQGEAARTVEIYHEDFNNVVHKILRPENIGERTATFCLLDQRTFECHWQTVVALAKYKTEGMKIELFYFVPTGWLGRALAGLRDHSIADKWWGNSNWQELRNIRSQNRANLFCDRFQQELGYRTAVAWPIYERAGGGRVMYHMIHATDHPEAPNLMSRAYRKAVTEIEPVSQLEFEFSLWQETSGV
jgi:three-Cys-motif partner protein